MEITIQIDQLKSDTERTCIEAISGCNKKGQFHIVWPHPVKTEQWHFFACGSHLDTVMVTIMDLRNGRPPGTRI